jgi:hypothetical protein
MKLALLLCTAALFGAACAPVRPWERGALAHRSMQPDARPEESRARTHMLNAREGSQGAEGEAGGGCGCK